MKRTYRTYQWVDGRIEDVGTMHGIPPKESQSKAALETTRSGDHINKIGIQDGLLLFTFSSLLMVFAGGALFVFLFVIYAMIFY